MNIAELRRLEAEATPGPWWSDGEYQKEEAGLSIIAAREDSGPLPGNPTRGQVAFVTELLPENASRAEADASLIVAMRNALPELLKALEWQDMSTAPRDGTEGLFFSPGNPKAYNENAREPHYRIDIFSDKWPKARHQYPEAPYTCWRPLPPHGGVDV